ncbi:unnamed protein product [Adineta steineri]|uniref:Uncharacterized protein n=1 Tax=Adineta steineri TaxID=433720 RepID=A0A813PWF5_9BILA|nr:unnamed protein product [Adineta steineri]CAF0759407.1 unnamed protein product [Adineta steineri]CAF4037077.1 unnamed protein product [Adineta steineri]CAF4070181.1 unnamed protein product [Adineta steineri]
MINEKIGTNQRYRQQLHSNDLSTQKPNCYNKQSSTKTRNNDRQRINSRFKQNSSTLNTTINKKNQPV